MKFASEDNGVAFLINELSRGDCIYKTFCIYGLYLFILLQLLYSVCVVLLLVDWSLEKDFWSRKKRSSTLKNETAAVYNLRKKSKSDILEDQAIQAIGGKDASIFLFHALGKIIYCKSKKSYLFCLQ